MSQDLVQRIIIDGQDEASASIRAVEASIRKLVATTLKANEVLQKSFSGDLLKGVTALKTESREFGTGLAESAAKAAKVLREDVAAVNELRSALRAAVTEQTALAKAAATTRAASAAAGGAGIQGVQATASARARAARDEVRDVGRIWRIRERSEKDELDHLKKVKLERRAMRREAWRAGRHALGHADHAVRRLSSPYFDSPALAAEMGAAFGVEAARKIVEGTIDLDTATTRLEMFAPGVNAVKARHQALLDSIDLGVDAAKVVDIQAKAVRDGVAPEIARALPKSVAAAAQVMGGDIEKLTDSLAEGIQESAAMGWIRNAGDARRYLNIEAGLSTTAGNTPLKMEEYVAAGGLGHGREMGLDMTSSLAYGAMLNASGMRTGQASARFLGQLSQSVPKMADRYRAAATSRRNSEEDRAVRSAPAMLGYGGIREMQQRILAGPEGLIDFAERLQKLDDKTRKLILEGYGFSEQGGAALAEIGVGSAKSKSVLARAKELSKQTEANDYLSTKFSEWQTSLAYMLKQIEAGWKAIEIELGDVIKVDILEPIRDWWVDVSSQIVNSGLKSKVHDAIIAFIHGLGFNDVRDMLQSLTRDVQGFDFVQFAHGVGEGIRTLVDDVKAVLAPIRWLAGDGDAESIGKLGTELLGLALAAHAIGPVIGIIGSLSSAFLAMREALTGVSIASKLLGITSAIEALGTAAGVGVAGGAIMAVSIAAIAVGAIAVTVANWADITKFWTNLFGRNKENLPKEQMDGLMQLQSYKGDDWAALRQGISYSPSDSGDVVMGSLTDTARGVWAVKTSVDRLGDILRVSSLGGGDGGSGGGGGGIGGDFGAAGTRSMRYGREGGGDVGPYRGAPRAAKGALAANQREAYKAALDAGLSPTAARALVANMSGESLTNPKDYHWDRKHMSGGIVQWDPQRAAAIKAKFGKLPWEMSVAEQTKAAIWEIQNNPRFAKTASALKGNDPNAMIGALVRNYESPADSAGAIRTRQGYYAGFNPEGGSSGPMSGDVGQRIASLQKAGLLTDEQCVTLAMASVGIRKGGGIDGSNVHSWTKGDAADSGLLKPGTPIATFLNRDGSQSSRYAGGGSGTPGAHLDHAGIFERYIMDAAGKRIGMMLAEQYKGSHGIHDKAYYFGQGRGEGNGSNYFAIRDSQGRYLGGANNPMTVKVDPKSVPQAQSPGDIAGKVQSYPRPAPGTGDAPVSGRMTTADATVTNHNTFHIHGRDPEHVARTVAGHLDLLASKPIDVPV